MLAGNLTNAAPASVIYEFPGDSRPAMAPLRGNLGGRVPRTPGVVGRQLLVPRNRDNVNIYTPDALIFTVIAANGWIPSQPTANPMEEIRG